MQTGRQAFQQVNRHASSWADMNKGSGGGSHRPNRACVDLPLPKPPPAGGSPDCMSHLHRPSETHQAAGIRAWRVMHQHQHQHQHQHTNTAPALHDTT